MQKKLGRIHLSRQIIIIPKPEWRGFLEVFPEPKPPFWGEKFTYPRGCFGSPTKTIFLAFLASKNHRVVLRKFHGNVSPNWKKRCLETASKSTIWGCFLWQIVIELWRCWAMEIRFEKLWTRIILLTFQWRTLWATGRPSLLRKASIQHLGIIQQLPRLAAPSAQAFHQRRFFRGLGTRWIFGQKTDLNFS